MMTKMTAREVASLRATDKTKRVGVDAGLHLHIAIDGTKTWVVRYSINERQSDYRLPKRYGLVTDDSHLLRIQPVNATHCWNCWAGVW
jgi:hypothetical protein